MAQTRRRFLKVTGAAIAGSTLFDVETLFAGPPFVRKDVGGLTGSSPDLVAYGNAINAMKALPNTNPLPLYWLVPDLIVTLVIAPPDRPNSAS